MAKQIDFWLQLLIAYVLICIIAYYVLAPLMMYVPPKNTYKDDATVIKLTTADGTVISAVYLEQPTAEYTILFSHGNAEDLGTFYPLLEQYVQHGFSILAYDYHGYGTSKGFPSETNTYEDIEAAYNYLLTKTPAKKIIALGRSLGSGPTIYLAAHHELAGVVLESPFLTAFTVITKIPIFPIDRYRNNSRINAVKAPILIIHGTEDEVINFYHGKKLYDLIQQPNKHFIAATGAGHNDLIDKMGLQYFHELKMFAQKISK